MQSKTWNRLLLQDNNTFSLIDYAINNKLTPFISMQNHYNLVYREEEREMFPTLKVVAFFFMGAHPINSFFCSTSTLDRFHGPHLVVVF